MATFQEIHPVVSSKSKKDEGKELEGAGACLRGLAALCNSCQSWKCVVLVRTCQPAQRGLN